MADEITFTAKIEYVVYWDEKSSWGVLEISTNENLPHSREKFDFDLDTNQMIQKYTTRLVGNMPTPNTGAVVIVTAFHEYNTKFKKDQFTVLDLRLSKPKTLQENTAYLKSLVTERQAESLLSVYPNIVDDIIAGNDKIDLSLLNGIGQFTYDKIKEKVIENFAISDILSFLIPLGVSYGKIKTLLGDEPNPQILKERIINDPYNLTNIKGVSFLTADKIAVKLNPNLRESELRLSAFIKHNLESIGDSDGDCWVTLDRLKSDIIKNVPECEKFLDVFIEKERVSSRFLHIENDTVGLNRYYRTEKFIYEFLEQVHNAKPLEITDEQVQKGIEESEMQQGFSFSTQQKEILYDMTKNSLNCISGIAGSGKTALSRAILNIYSHAGYSVAVCALSAKAAKRSMEMTGYNATTIHRLLESDSHSFIRNEKNLLTQRTILVDEASMLNSYLLMSLFKAINPEKTKIILVGDHAQLAPIQFGQPFTDIITSENKYQKNVLTEVYRQAKNSSIFIDAMMIRNKQSPVEEKERIIKHGDITYVFSDDKEYLHEMALKSYFKAVKEDGIENVVLLSPRKKEVLNSTSQFNVEIQKLVNSENLNNKFTYGKKTFLLDDRVIATKNSSETGIYNGFLGVVTEIRRDGFTAVFDDNIVGEYNKENIDEIELSGSISSHRSQGSQYLSVIVVLDMSSFMLLSNQMLYTSVSRGQKRVLVCAQPKAFDMCLRESENERNTYLRRMLENGI